MTQNESSQPPPPPGAWLRPELVASWREILLVILVMVGPFAWRSGLNAWNGSAPVFMGKIFTDERLVTSLVSEGVMLSFFLWLLHRRGWRVSDLRIRPGILSSLQGFGLLAAVEIAQIVTKFVTIAVLAAFRPANVPLLTYLHSYSPHIALHSIMVSWSAIFAAMILNAFFEEIVCTGYVFTQLATKWGPGLGLFATLVLRLACHTYQGPMNLLPIGAVFLIFGLWYWWTRNLWPLIVAHALLDITSGALLKGLYG